MTNQNLCTLCQKITVCENLIKLKFGEFDRVESWRPHHSAVQHLRASAEAGCALCNLMVIHIDMTMNSKSLDGILERAMWVAFEESSSIAALRFSFRVEHGPRPYRGSLHVYTDSGRLCIAD